MVNAYYYLIAVSILSDFCQITTATADFACMSVPYNTTDRLKPKVNIRLFKQQTLQYSVDANMFNLDRESILTIGTNCSSNITNFPTVNVNFNKIVNNTVYPSAQGSSQFYTLIEQPYESMIDKKCLIFYKNANNTIDEVSCGDFIAKGEYIVLSTLSILLLVLLIIN